MAHPYAEVRQSKVERARVPRMTRGYASGGGVHSDEKADRKLVKGMVKKGALRASGGAVAPRFDRPSRKKGGRVKSAKGSTVNVVIGSHGPPQAPVAGLAPPPAIVPPPIGLPAAPPPRPPMAGPPGPGLGPVPLPGMPPRSHGGRTYAKGGGVKGSKVYEDGKRAGTQVSHDLGKNDLGDLGRKKPITFKTGGAIEHPQKGGMAPPLPGGAGGGLARIAKEKRAARRGNR